MILKVLLVYLPLIYGHGYMIKPIQRSSLWRINSSAPINYDDNGLNCGNKFISSIKECGICGDSINASIPRDNELYGKYYTGVIVEKITKRMNINIILSANHKGYFIFYLCNLDIYKKESFNCFKKINNKKYFIKKNKNFYNITIKLNKKIKCKHCILKWVYITGNNWKYKNKEFFINCADITIF